jgi:hypothetical protein
MSTTIRATNINEAFYEGIWKLRVEGVDEQSERGPVRVMPGPVMTTFLHPDQRVLFNPKRDANPVFHLMEAIWMLAGRDDVEFLLPFNSRYSSYAEPDGTVHGAYGKRWSAHFGIDQIVEIIQLLKKKPTSRQAVLQMWDVGAGDLTGNWKDRPCNTHIYFDCRYGRLNMTVCCRSNDLLWGAYGANVVHFSILQEVIAHGVGIPIGLYHQFSNNFHVYLDLPMALEFMQKAYLAESHDYYYDVHHAQVFPLLQPGESAEKFLDECANFCSNITPKFENQFLTRVALPLRAAYINRQAGDPLWRNFLHEVPMENDWKIAFNEWVARRDK